ncbi:DUF802 domain-containing protein [Noviherbaspirillum sp. UKPF54]|uniref:DUF802 domain-containing protein n=1 Tax=Noviherbaspirillum sp. UKPF54 TaxID=2601898 RepID=UPI0011B14C52|nr:DUF802 domain-containing protein [Noviherbaspirillum sp. UKPF54]QDZ27124.1 DUF802 domain-containing protein [Noviherbaspirillum sp. UKPF54]
MNRHLFTIAFFLGALGIVWAGAGFVDSGFLALAMTAIIGAVYGAGALELRRFRQATSTLEAALAAIPDNLAELGDWLGKVHPSLQNPVRLRVEGERVGLPGPALTPYLVGLLVMLGMLGTFLGMVVTLKGAVFALEKTTDLAAIRSALAVPVKGLGLAFGTSVAGVAASAMLGLMSSLSRRERTMAAQLLDTRITTVLRRFSLAHQRQETFKALQMQSQALPAVVDQLQAMMAKMEGMNQQLGQQLSERLLGNQEDFHRNVKSAYADLAQSVDRSLRESLSQSAHAAGESIRPVLEATMNGIARDTAAMHERMAGAVQTQLDGLSARFDAATSSVAETWTAALKSHEQASAGVVEQVGRSLEAFNETFEQRAGALVATVGEAYASLQADQAERDRQRQQAWTQSLEAMAAALTQEWQQAGAQSLTQQQKICDVLTRTAQDVGEQVRSGARDSLAETARLITSAEELMRSRITAEAQWIEQNRERMDQLASLLRTELGALRDEEAARGNAALERMGQLQTDLSSHFQASMRDTLAETARLITSAEELMRSRIAAEAQWIEQHRVRMEQLAGLLRSELGALKEQEAARGDAAVERLGQLQAALASHLTTLGTALEEPIARLIETASQAPRAAAEVIGQLRQQISGSVARDNELLEERSRIMETLNALLSAINHASLEQRAAIDSLVASSGNALNATASAFADNVAAEAAKLTDIAANVTGSAADVASLSEAFGFAVQSFNEANEKLIENLQRIEGAMDKSMSRSDEQLAYYVAQAREIIDLSMISQKEIVESLRRLPARQAMSVEGDR